MFDSFLDLSFFDSFIGFVSFCLFDDMFFIVKPALAVGDKKSGVPCPAP